MSWWDGVELWLVGLPFALQVAVTMVVVLPLCAGAAIVVDRGVEVVAALLGGRTRRSWDEQRDE
ncbi:MAG: hypothetical protein ACXVXI_00310 [Mycobacteriaceae bacterium]